MSIVDTMIGQVMEELRELIHEHREYWLKTQSDVVPNLDLYMVDVHPSRNDNISLDRDGHQ